MAIFKTVWAYAGPGGDSFAETFYRDASTLNLAAVTDPPMLLARLNMLHPLYTLQRIRISQVDSLNQPAVQVPINRIGTWPGDGTAAGLPAVADNAIVCALAGVLGGSRKWWQRGVANNAYGLNKDGSQNSVPQWQTAFDAFVNAANAAKFGLYPQDRSQPRYILTSIDGSLKDGTSVIDSVQPTGFAKGTLVNIYKTDPKQWPALNGTFQVIASLGVAGAFHTQIRYRTPGDKGATPLSGEIRASVRPSISLFDPGRCKFDHMGAHTTKSPLSRSRGARRAKRLRPLA